MTDHSQDAGQTLQQAASLIQAGRLDEAKRLVASVLKANPRNATAWYLASLLTEDIAKKRQALQRTLAIEPNHNQARVALNQLEANADPLDELLGGVPEKVASAVLRPNSNLLIIASVVGVALIVVILFVLLQLRNQRPSSTIPDVAIMPSSTQLPTRTPSIAATVTRSATVTSSVTRTATRTQTTSATSTATSLLSIGKHTTGIASAQIFSSAADPIGKGLGDFTVTGQATVSFNQGILNIGVDPEPSIHWTFAFYAPNLEVGKLYSNAVLFPVPNPQTHGIVIAGAEGRRCRQVDGEFIVEQATPLLIVSFLQLCEKDESKIIRGKVTFTLAALFTPTPTIPAEKLLKFVSGSGEVKTDLVMNEKYPLRDSRIKLPPAQGPGNLLFDKGLLTITAEEWRFILRITVLEKGHRYENAKSTLASKQGPGIDISDPFGRNCETTIGNYLVDQIGESVIITFNHICGQSGDAELRGTITFTPLSALTPTPTIPVEKLFKPANMIGEVQLALHSSATNPIGTPGDHSLQGPGDLQVDPQSGEITFRMSPITAPEVEWNFTLAAPIIRVGDTYEAPRNAERVSISPTLRIETKLPRNEACSGTSGRFKIEQQQPTIVFTFFQICQDNPSKTMEGKFSFTPASQLPPIATIAPSKVLKDIPAEGELEVDAVSEGTDPVGNGQGKITFKGRGGFKQENGTLNFTVRHADDKLGSWRFSFFSGTMEIGKRYEPIAHIRYNGLRRFPAMEISHVRLEMTRGDLCSRLGGYFTVEQQSPTVVISFLYQCDRTENHIFRGKITYTPASQLTPTPSALPERLINQPMKVSGKAIAELNISGKGPLGNGQGRSTVEGFSQLSILDRGSSAFQIGIPIFVNLKPSWTFSFAASGLQTGRTYPANMSLADGVPDIPQMSVSVGGMACRKFSGEFQVEHQSPHMVITFSQQCTESGNQKITGKLTFIPDSALPPTPTVPPERLVKLTPGQGHVKGTFSESRSDRVGQAPRNTKLDAQGELINTATDSLIQIYVIARGNTAAEIWSFNFFAPTLEVGKRYTNVAHIDERHKGYPGMSFATEWRRCTNGQGEFTIEQQSPALVISFVWECKDEPAGQVKGTVTFTPN